MKSSGKDLEMHGDRWRSLGGGANFGGRGTLASSGQSIASFAEDVKAVVSDTRSLVEQCTHAEDTFQPRCGMMGWQATSGAI